MKIEPKMIKRPCGFELKTKQWKQGSSISCLEKGETVVSTPAPLDEGYMKARIEEFCKDCKIIKKDK